MPSPGQSNVPVTVQPGSAPCDAAGLAAATQVKAGAWHSLALVNMTATGGEVCDWGRNSEDQLGHGPGPDTAVPQLVCAPYSANPATCSPLQNVTAISGGGLFSMALVSSLTIPGPPGGGPITLNNAIVEWGGGYEGELGNGTTVNSAVPQLVCRTVPAAPYAIGVTCPDTSPATAFLTGVKAIAGGEYGALALMMNGRVKAWGSNTYCELGIGNFCSPPAAGHHGPYTGGCNLWGTTSPSDCSVDPVTVLSSTPAAHPPLGNVTAIAAGDVQNVALLANGTVMTWGINNFGQLGNGTFNGPNQCFNDRLGLSFPCGWYAAHVVGGDPKKGKPCFAGSRLLSRVAAIAAGFPNDLALLSDRIVCSWGGNSNGELGIGSTANSDRPVAVWNVAGSANNLLRATAISVGLTANDLAIIGGGRVAAWGNGTEGEMGNNTTGAINAIPVTAGFPSALAGITLISAGARHSLAFP